MEIVSGRTGKPHVTSQQFRQIIEGTVGQGSYIITSGENLEPELVSNNLLKIRSGMMCHHGNVSCVKLGTYDEVELTNGSQGMKRIDLVVNRYTRNEETGVESNEWVVLMGKPDAKATSAPSYAVGNLQDGDLVDDCPVFEVHYDGINITEVKSLLKTLNGLSSLNDYIVEQGRSGIWTYRKWNSGIAECWGTTTVTIAKWEAWGTLYEGYPRIESISFPTSLFMTDDVAWQVTANSYMGIVSVESASLVTKLQTPLMWILRPNASTQNDSIRVSMEARGRWK